jgi:hypothetical protein
MNKPFNAMNNTFKAGDKVVRVNGSFGNFAPDQWGIVHDVPYPGSIRFNGDDHVYASWCFDLVGAAPPKDPKNPFVTTETITTKKLGGTVHVCGFRVKVGAVSGIVSIGWDGVPQSTVSMDCLDGLIKALTAARDAVAA